VGKLIPLDFGDVVSVNSDESFARTTTSTVGEMIRALVYAYRQRYNLGDSVFEKWITQGIECDVLQVGKQWQKGRLCIKVEFIPDEVEPENTEPVTPPQEIPESPLDDLRQHLKELN
jgi:hypothetical protein